MVSGSGAPERSQAAADKKTSEENQAEPVDTRVQNDPLLGGKAAASAMRSFTLRVSGKVIDQVDAAVSKHPIFRNRNTWIVNAIVEQLKREGAELT